MKHTIILALTWSGSIAAQAYTLDFNTAKEHPTTHVLTDDGFTYETQVNGDINAPVIEAQGGPDGAGPAYLRMSAPRSPGGTEPNGNDTDRFEYILSDEHSTNCPRFGSEAHTESLWLYVNPDCGEPSHQGVVVAQWWQGAGGAARYSPPVYLYLTKPRSRQDPWGISLNVKNDQTGHQIGDKPVVVWQGGIWPGKWHFYSFTALPSYTGAGFAQMSADGVVVGTYQGNVGYTPRDVPGGLRGAGDSFRVKFGLYRPDGSPAMNLGFDAVSYH